MAQAVGTRALKHTTKGLKKDMSNVITSNGSTPESRYEEQKQALEKYMSELRGDNVEKKELTAQEKADKKKEILDIKDNEKRIQAIAKHMELFENKGAE